MLALLDTATGQVAPLEARDAGRLSVYVCGPTVAGYPHLGHARFNLIWDALRRYLVWRGVQVHYVSNVTDIEDKIIARAAEEGTSSEDVASRYEQIWFETMAALGVKRPDDTPHATAYVGHMVRLVNELVERGHAYQGGDGIYFDTASLPGYGLLARQDLSMVRAGERVNRDQAGKRSPLDFVLWKFAGADDRAQGTAAPWWASPWGRGRPGWHTECVVMSLDLLGEGFDLHLGGLDLAFPHHENERAQAVATGRAFARRWAHNGMVLDEQGEKMSRSVGNVISLGSLLARYDPRVLRVLMLNTHYRAPLTVNQDTIDNAQGVLNRFDNFARESKELACAAPDEAALNRFKWRLDEDFDTPGALTVMLGAIRDARAHPERVAALATAVREGCQALGLELPFEGESLDERVAEMVRQRDAARARADYPAADSIRADLQAMGYVVEDGPAGTSVWRP
ncbi:MAG TPA: cysteine--tRNA ligase [Acidimicrobiales bacterium]|nr:cysteine--tRNA ligase [Acidimicrobiales bacterium]